MKQKSDAAVYWYHLEMRMQKICIVLTIIAISLFFIPATREFTTTDPTLPINFVLPAQQKSINFTLVQSGMIITDMPEIDTQKNEFKINAIIWFEFKPSQISLDTIGKFTFENGSIDHKSDPTTEIVGDKTLAQYAIKATFSTPLNYRLFPIDDHKVSLALTNKLVSPGEMLYQIRGSDFVFKPQIMAPGWTFAGKHIAYGYTNVSKIGKHDISHPLVIFSIDLQKKGFGSILIVFLPLLFMFFIAMVSLSLVKIGDNTGLGIALGNVSALIAFRFVLQSLLPRVGYLTLTDYIYSYVLFVAFIGFVMNFIFFLKKDKAFLLKLAKIRIISIPLFYGFLIGLFYYLLFVKG